MNGSEAPVGAPLPESARSEITVLWDEYEAASSPEARVAKALDKLETILQHTQGENPPDFDYRFNLGYGRAFTADHPAIVRLREMLDRETQRLADAAIDADNLTATDADEEPTRHPSLRSG